MIRERVRAVLGRVPEPAKSWLKDQKALAERSVAKVKPTLERVKRKEAVLKEKLQGLRIRASELRQALRSKSESTPAPALTVVSNETVSE